MSFVGSALFCTKDGGSDRKDKTFESFRVSMLPACSPLLPSIEKPFSVNRLRIEYLNGDVSLQLNGLLNIYREHCKENGKVYQSIDRIFSIICAFANETARYTEEGSRQK